MPNYLLDPALLPEPLWNSHLACLQSLARAGGRPLDSVDIAGYTGLCLRTSLCRNAAPASLYYSWPWPADFGFWCSALGLDCEAALCTHENPARPQWTVRQARRLEEGLAQGRPGIIWNGLCFSLVCGCTDSHLLISPLSAQCVNAELPLSAELRRLLEESTAGAAGAAARTACSWSMVDAAEGEDSFVLCMYGQRSLPQIVMDYGALLNCWLELSGRREYARLRISGGSELAALFGTKALARLVEELQGAGQHPFGMYQACQSLVELRRLAAPFLRRVSLRLPEYTDRLEQCAQFMEQALAHYRRLADIHHAPEISLRREQQQQARHALWEALRFEETVQRLLGSIVQEVFELAP